MIHKAKQLQQAQVLPVTLRKIPVDWIRARCSGLGTEIFFDQSEINEGSARALCQSCPIQVQCMMHGLTQCFGMWGGMTEQERRQFNVRKMYTTCECGRPELIIMNNAFCAHVCQHCGVGISQY